MEKIEKLKERLKTMVGENRLAELFDDLDVYLPNNSIGKDKLILQKKRFLSIEAEKAKGTFSTEVYLQEMIDYQSIKVLNINQNILLGLGNTQITKIGDSDSED